VKIAIFTRRDDGRRRISAGRLERDKTFTADYVALYSVVSSESNLMVVYRLSYGGRAQELPVILVHCTCYFRTKDNGWTTPPQATRGKNLAVSRSSTSKAAITIADGPANKSRRALGISLSPCGSPIQSAAMIDRSSSTTSRSTVVF